MRRLVTIVALAVGMVPALPVAADHLPPNGYFVDDDTSIHEADIDSIAAAGITRGCNPPVNDRFCPSGSVTRGQMAAFLRRSLGLPASSTNYFFDDNDSIFEEDINAIAEARITVGCSGTASRYCPNDLVTRGQMAAFLRRAFNVPVSGVDAFSDDDDSIFERDINAIAAAGITFGCGPDAYCPDRPVTRAQMSSFLTRAIGLPHVLVHQRLDLALPFSGSCNADQTSCSVTVAAPNVDEYLITEGWFYEGAFQAGDDVRFADATVTVTIDGQAVALAVTESSAGTMSVRSFSGTIGKLAPGRHTIIGRWYWDGMVVYTTTIRLDVAE